VHLITWYNLPPDISPPEETQPSPTPIHTTPPTRRPDSGSSQGPSRSPSPLFIPERHSTDPPTSAGIVSVPVQPPVASEVPPPSDEDVREWIVTSRQTDKDLLTSFSQNSWGTAYKTIAEVQVVLRICKAFRIKPNYACHNVSTGHFFGRNKVKRTIEFRVIGSYMNGQSAGTWTNKLTFFFAVRQFLERTAGLGEEDIRKGLYEVCRAMADWGVKPEKNSFLPVGDPRASYRLTPTRKMICKYNTDRK
jgi:hypothetical protein